MPAASWPKMQGNKPSGSSPLSVYKSVWHPVAAMIFMRTSPAFGGSTTTVQTSTGSLAAQATAALHSIGFPYKKARYKYVKLSNYWVGSAIHRW